MKERPILFSAPMVRALLDGTKTQTRRIVKPTPTSDSREGWARDQLLMIERGPRAGHALSCPYGVPGDRLWVRESFWSDATTKEFMWYVNDLFTPDRTRDHCRLTPGIHMPRRLCRIVLEVTDVRVERLQDISEEDAAAEGCKADTPETWWQGYMDTGEPCGLLHQQTMGDEPPDWMIEPRKCNPTPWLVHGAKKHYQMLWGRINGFEGDGSWDANPWVWAVSFDRADSRT